VLRVERKVGGKVNVGSAASGEDGLGTIVKVDPGTRADIPHNSDSASGIGIEQREDTWEGVMV